MSHQSHHGALGHISKASRDRTVDAVAYIVGIGGNVAVIPQIIKSWSGPTPGMSIATWVLFSSFGCVWLVYAIYHKQKPLIAAQIAGLACNVAVVTGWLIHK